MPKGGNGGGGNGGGPGAIKGNKRDNLLEGTSGDDLIQGNAGNDTLFGYDGADTLEGGLDDDLLDGGAGDDSIDGGEGTDTVVFSGARDDYVVTQIDETTVEITGPDGTDVITDVEFFNFSDMTQSLAEVVVPRLANLTAGTLTLSATDAVAGEPLTATFVIASNGVIDAAATGATLVIATAPDLGSVIQSQGGIATDPLATGTSQTLVQGIDTSGLAAGVYYVAVIADEANALEESDEGDNQTEWVQITIAEPFQNLSLDYVYLAIAGNDFDLNDGAYLQFDASVSNTGNIGGGTFTITAVLSTDLSLSPDDLVFASTTYTLQPGETVDLSLGGLVDPDWPAGDYNVIAYISSYDGIDQVPIDDIAGVEVTLIGGTTYGTAGNDWFAGLGVDETFDLGAGDDTVLGSSGEDVILGGDGFDMVDYSGLGFGIEVYDASYYTGVPGLIEVVPTVDPYGYPYEYWSDYLDGVEMIVATEHDDQVWIDTGPVRWIATLGGDDIVVGSVGDDTIEAGAGNDSIGGMGGDDLIFTGEGADELYFDYLGGAGQGHDVVVDFDPLNDVIYIVYGAGEPFPELVDVRYSAEGARILYGLNSSVVLHGVDPTEINETNLMVIEDPGLILY